MIKEIQIAAKLYNMRDTAKRFFKSEYDSKLEPYKKFVKDYMTKSGLDELKSVMELVKLESVKDNGMAQLLFFSAAVELIESTNKMS